MKTILAASLVMIAMAAAPVKAQTLDGSDVALGSAQALVDLCSAEGSESNAVKARIFCHGYLSGAMEFHAALAADDAFAPLACPGRKVTREQMAAEVVKWADGRETLARMSPIEAVARAAQARWPCK